VKSKDIKIQGKLQESIQVILNEHLSSLSKSREISCCSVRVFVEASVKEKARTQIFMFCISNFATSWT